MTLPNSDSIIVSNVKLEAGEDNLNDESVTPMDVDITEDTSNACQQDDSEEEGQVSEEGEIWDSGGDSPSEHRDYSSNVKSHPSKVYRGIATILEEVEEPDSAKLEERAKRFGLDPSEPRPILSKQIRDLYESMGVDPHDKLFRLNTIHVRGTESMNTQDVFDYFKEYAPAAVEWIKDYSCNVVWTEEVSPARALLETSKKIVNDPRPNGTIKYNEEFISDDEIAPSNRVEERDVVKASDLKEGLPPGIWRKGKDCSKSDSILLRIATNADKKVLNNIKNDDYINQFGIVSSHRRGPLGKEMGLKPRTHYDVGDELAASDARAKLLSKTGNPWSGIAYTWGMFDRTKYPVAHPPVKETEEAEDFFAGLPQHSPFSKKVGINSEDGEEWRSRIKAPRMRMHADDEASGGRRILKASRRSDVRSRLGGKEFLEIAPLQIKVERGSSISDNDERTEVDVSDSAPVEDDSFSTLQITRVVSPVQGKRPKRKAPRQKKTKKRKVESSSSSSSSSSDDESSSDSSSSSSSSSSSGSSSSSDSSSGSSSDSSSSSSSDSSSSNSSSSDSSSSSSDSESDTQKVAKKKIRKQLKPRKSVLQGAQSHDRQQQQPQIIFSSNYRDDIDEDEYLPVHRSAVYKVSSDPKPYARDLRFSLKNSRNSRQPESPFKRKRPFSNGNKKRHEPIKRLSDHRREPLKGITDLREKLRNRKMNKMEDERFSMDSPLRIEVDNDYYRR